MIHRFVERLLPFVFVCCFPDVQLLFQCKRQRAKSCYRKHIAGGFYEFDAAI